MLSQVVEPSYAAWEAAVLPLNYTRIALCLGAALILAQWTFSPPPIDPTVSRNKKPAAAGLDWRPLELIAPRPIAARETNAKQREAQQRQG